MLQSEDSELQNNDDFGDERTQTKQIRYDSISRPNDISQFNIEFNDSLLFNNPLMDPAELYRQIVDTTNEGIWVCDLNSRLVFSNRKASEMLGYSREELIGRSVFNFVSKEGASIANRFFERRKQGLNDQYDQTLMRKDGTILWVTITASPVKDRSGNVVGALGMLTDISQRKIAETDLVKSEEKFAAAFRTSPNGLVISDINTGTLLDVNDTFLALFERERDQVIGKSSLGLNIYSNPDDRQKIKDLLEKDGRVTNFELKIKVPSGKEKSIRVSVEKLHLKEQEVMLTTIQDVTELKLTQNNLRQSEELYRHLVDSANSIILRWNADGTIRYMNDYGLRYFGYSPGEIIGMHAGILVPEVESTGKNLSNLTHQIIQNAGKYIQIENENVRKNGERVWISWTNKTIEGNDGNIEILAIGNDITNLKKTKEALKIEHDKLQAIIENMGIGVIVTDSRGSIISLNKAAMKIHDYQSEEDYKARMDKFFEDFELRTFAGEKIPFEDWPNLMALGGYFVKSYEAILFNLRTNSSKYLSYNVSPVFDGNHKLKYTIFNITDLSEIHKNEQLLREKEERFRALADNMSQMGWIADQQGRVIWFNKRWYDFTGLEIKDIYEGKYLEIHHPDYIEYMKTSYEASISSGEPWEATLPIKNKAGEYRWFLARALPIRDNKGNINLWFGTNTDITEQRQNEEMLQKQNQELQKAKEKAEESVRFKNAFIANISHEIRTPMSGILGFADLLKSPDLSSESKNSYIETIISSGKRMLGIINDLIYISKIEAGHLELYKDVTDLHKLIDELKVFFLPEATKKNLELKVNKSLPPNKTLTETDKTKLSQVLTNLIKNAIKYTTTGYIEFGCQFQGNYYIFYVKDTGIGIKEEHQLNIFERFKQGEVSTEALEGLGIGLAISKSLVEVLGGNIWVESEPKLGSTFYFTLPYKDQVYETKSPSNEMNANNAQLSGCEILIAEDEEFIHYFLDQFLSKKKIKTLHARNGEEAVNMVMANPNIQLVLMDTRMPVLNGLEATKRIKQLKPDLPVIALSAFASSHDVQQTMKAGCVDYIVKPFDKEIVMQKILMYVNPIPQ